MQTALLNVQPSRFSPLFRKLSLTLCAGAFVAITTTSSFAGTTEYTALNKRLGGDTKNNKVATATTADLVANIQFFLNPANNTAKLNPAIIAGEAIKFAGSNALDAGVQIANLLSSSLPITYGTKSVTSTFDAATFAIKAASTGKGSSVAQVPSFAGVLITDQVTAIKLSAAVKASKLAAGAVLGGYAKASLTTDGQKQGLANAAFADKTVNAASLEIASYISRSVTDGAAFVTATAGLHGISSANKQINVNGAFADKIVVGAATGLPTQAGAITDAALSITDATKVATVANPVPRLLLAKAATLAKSLGAVSDIEQIEKIGEQIGKRIGSVGGIKLSQATAIVTTLAKAIIAKPTPIGAEQTNIHNPLRNTNKTDELGELAAYMIGAISSSAEFTATTGTTTVKAKIADKTVIAIIKAVVSAAKTKTPGTTGPVLADVLEYVVGSVALTVNNLYATSPTAAQTTVKNAILAALALPANQKALAALIKLPPATGTATVAEYITRALANGNTVVTGGQGKFENGLDATAGLLTDPETNSRNL